MVKGFVNLHCHGDDCWLWTGHLRNGYPYTKNRRANRVVFELFHRKLRSGEVVHHTCETKACLNPRHLVAMSNEEHRQLHGHDKQLYTKTSRSEVWARRSEAERTAIMEKAWAGRRK